MASAQKKQQSISSFFKKPAASSSPTSTTAATRLPLAPKSTNGGHHSESDDDDFVVPPLKRQKRSEHPTEPQPINADKETAEQPSETCPTTQTAQLPSRVTSRTSKYLFSSQSFIPEHGAQEDNPEERIRKEKLHSKFVKKLGRPDSIADIKRRNRGLVDETNEEVEVDDDDAEVEPPVEEKPKGRKGVGAVKKSSSKLTPMEKQVLEIKRAHMDTLLVVEVGYKFRFFGEDARVAAKELSIVCIPGKLRYDERRGLHSSLVAIANA